VKRADTLTTQKVKIVRKGRTSSMLKNIHFSIVRGIVSKRDSGTINVNDQMQYGNRKREAEAEKLRKKRRRGREELHN
jgi:hypothetical protein